MLCVKWYIALKFIWLGSSGFVLGDEGESGETILPAYMEPPSANGSPKCSTWLQIIFGKNKRPASRNEIDTNFHLFTRKNAESGININPYAEVPKGLWKTLREIRKTVVITHGFWSTAKEKWVKRMTKAFLEKEDANVITVDWKKGAKKWNYIKAVSNTKVVGKELAFLIQYLHRHFKIPFSSFHLVGHSLGAQISSYVSHHIGGKIGRLTALDPASPCFADVDKELRVDPSDADFVDVIHTNGKDLGVEKPVGHVDFYPNGGKEQPGCGSKNKIVNKLRKWLRKFKIVQAIDAVKATICSHSIACDYFIESIIVNTCRFWGHRWDQESIRSNNVSCDYQSCTPMGFDSGKFPARGVFYVPVKDGLPHCVEDRKADKKLLPWITDKHHAHLRR